MGAVVSHGRDLVAAGEEHVIVLPRGYRPGVDPPRRLVLVCHGANQRAVTAVSGVDEMRPLARHMADAGLIGLAIDCNAPPAASGLQNWGNAASVTRTQAAVDFAVASLGARADGILALTTSMGAFTLLNWARTRLGLLRGAALLIPGLDLQDIRDNNRSGAQGFIDTAYGGSGALAAAYPTRSPLVYRAELAGAPLRLWTSSDDPVCQPAASATFAAATGAPIVSLGAVGHSVSGLRVGDVVDYLAGRT